jgi:hypothetical protein
MRLMENETRRDLNPSEGYKHLRKNFPTKSTIDCASGCQFDVSRRSTATKMTEIHPPLKLKKN